MKRLIVLSCVFFATSLFAEGQLTLSNKANKPIIIAIETNMETYGKKLIQNIDQLTTLKGNKINSLTIDDQKIDAFTGIPLEKEKPGAAEPIRYSLIISPVGSKISILFTQNLGVSTLKKDPTDIPAINISTRVSATAENIEQLLKENFENLFPKNVNILLRNFNSNLNIVKNARTLWQTRINDWKTLINSLDIATSLKPTYLSYVTSLIEINNKVIQALIDNFNNNITPAIKSGYRNQYQLDVKEINLDNIVKSSALIDISRNSLEKIIEIIKKLESNKPSFYQTSSKKAYNLIKAFSDIIKNIFPQIYQGFTQIKK